MGVWLALAPHLVDDILSAGHGRLVTLKMAAPPLPPGFSQPQLAYFGGYRVQPAAKHAATGSVRKTLPSSRPLPNHTVDTHMM